MNTLGIFAKHPVAGRVKTRLAVELGDDFAAQAAEAFILDLAVRFQRSGDRRFLCYAPGSEEARSYFRAVAAEEYYLWPQPEIDLGGRMERFFREQLGSAQDRVVIIGSDSPTLPREFVERAFELLGDVDCVLGPATDGGYYLVGMRGTCWPVFSGVEWSGPRVFEQTVWHVQGLGAKLAVLPPWYDVDTVADWQLLRGHLRGLMAAGQGGAPGGQVENLSYEATARVLGLDIEDPDRAV